MTSSLRTSAIPYSQISFLLLVATLGVVEFFIFLLQKYDPNLNTAQKLVFADVHFTLFYTALFNAFQSVILCFFTSRISDRLWVRTEYQDLHHYLSIREEFERVKLLLYPEKGDHPSDDEMTENLFWSDLRNIGTAMWNFLRYPGLARKYQNLLVQIRFHELKVSFLKENALPPTFQVSTYLKRSELYVLTQLVHVSTFAWLLLTGAINLLYFLMGITLSVTNGDSMAVGRALSLVYMLSMLSFVVLSFIIFNKMKWIFRLIIDLKNVAEGDSPNEDFDQMSLFWGGDPKVFIVMIQFMQFGFAVGLSILLVFWNDIDVYYAAYPAWNFLVCVLVCYFSFVFIMARVIPRFTLCTSLGQLVDFRRLQESLAQHMLEEKKREIQTQKDRLLMKDTLRYDLSEAEAVVDEQPPTGVMKAVGQKSLKARESEKNNPSKGKAEVASTPISTERLEQLVQLSTSELRSALTEEEAASVHEREERLRQRRNRRKALSDGVSSMRNKFVSPLPSPAMTPNPSSEALPKLAEAKTTDNIDTQKRRSRRGRRKTQSASSAIQSMRDATLAESKATAFKAPDVKAAPFAGNAQAAAVAGAKSDQTPPLPPLSSVRRSQFGQNRVLSDVAEDLPSNPAGKYSSSELGMPVHPEAGSNLETLAEPIELSPPTPLSQPEAGSPIEIGDEDKLQVAETEVSNSEESAASDLPAIEESDRWPTATTPSLSLRDTLTTYFRSRRYQLTSAVFGTNVCFFFIAMRVEGILLGTGLLKDLDNSFQFRPLVTFWWELVLYVFFICGDMIILFLFHPARQTGHKDRVVFTSAIVDLAIVTFCTTMLLVAESMRCCSDETGTRFLAGEESVGKTFIVECCPLFGSRLHGGVGRIEPFTALVALRLIRFIVAQHIVLFLDGRNGWTMTESEHAGLSAQSVRHPFSPFYPKNKKLQRKVLRRQLTSSSHAEHEDHHKGHLQQQTGTIVELWKAALGLYPDVAKQHGEFSGELLQAMLGLELLASQGALPNEPSTRSVVGRSTSFHSHGDAGPRSLTVAKEFSGLDPTAQSVILSAQTGKSVRLNVSPTSAAVVEGSLAGSLQVPTKRPFFEVIEETQEELDENAIQFVAPDAPAVRKMRRCDKKLLPLFEMWTAVDVVLTKYEIVFLEAFDCDETSQSNDREDERMKGIREAIVATNGGKGLRLRDLAYGRKVVGHQELDTIEFLIVERILPHDSHVETEVGHQCNSEEYWKLKTSTPEGDSRCLRWSRVNEDHLKIKTKHDTLFLRFYSDLETSEHGGNTLFKNTTLQWCQTIGRFCGAAQLRHQSLPHFGDDNDEEVRDYLTIVEPEHHSRGRLNRRHIFGLGHGHENAAPGKHAAQYAGQRPSSFEHKLPAKPVASIRRSKTAGDKLPAKPVASLRRSQTTLELKSKILERQPSV